MEQPASRRVATPVAWIALVAAALALAVALLPAPLAHADDDPAADAATTAPAAPAAGPVPNVIITNFTYGDAPAAVGGDFTLGYTFQNMGRVAVQNMVVTVDGGEPLRYDPRDAGWTHCHATVLLDEPEARPHRIEIRMAPDAADKTFTILGFGWVK